jgi:tRNA (uracil-5-)-methyltransferase
MSETLSEEVPLEAKSDLGDKSQDNELKSEVVPRENETAPSKHDPYAYIVNNGFTSEKFKIEIRGLPRYYGIGVSKPELGFY